MRIKRRNLLKGIGAGLIAGTLNSNWAFADPDRPTAAHSTTLSHFSVMLWTIDSKAPIEQCLEMVAAAGYQGAELVSEFKKWSPDDVRRINSKMHSLGLVFDSVAGLDIRLADPDYSGRLYEQLTAHIQIVKELECRQIILTSGNRMETFSREKQHDACIENLKHVSDLVVKHDVELVIEPIDLLENKSAYLNSVTEAFEIVRAVGSPNIKVLYDFYHEQRGAGNLIEKLEQNIELVGLVHVADVPGRHEPGTGEIDYLNIYRKLAELKYRRFITMEYFPTGDPVESLKLARLVAQRASNTPTGPYKLATV